MGLFLLLASIAVTLVLTGIAYKYARELFSRKLRYVPAAQTSTAPVIAGIGAALVAWPLAGLLPLVTVATAVCIGVSVGMGAAAGVREVKGRLGGF